MPIQIQSTPAPVPHDLDEAVTAAFSEGHETPAERAPVDLDSLSGARAYLCARMCGPGGVLGGPSGGGLMGHALNTLFVALDEAIEGPAPARSKVRAYRVLVEGDRNERRLIVAASHGIEALERSRAFGRATSFDRLDDELVLPPAPPPPAPELPARVFALVGYGTPRTVGLSAHPRDLAHLIHVDERAAFMRAAGDQPWDGDRLERLWQLERKGADGRPDWATLEVVEPIRSGLVGPALGVDLAKGDYFSQVVTPSYDGERRLVEVKTVTTQVVRAPAACETDGEGCAAEENGMEPCTEDHVARGVACGMDLDGRRAAAAPAPARKPVEGELTREALLADTDAKRRVRTLKFVRLRGPDPTGDADDADEFRLIDPRRSSLAHAGLVAPHERGLVVSAGFFEVDLEDFTACVTDESSRSLDTGPLPDGEDNEALHAFLWPEASGEVTS